MKIKLAILEQDQTYLNRVVSVFNTKYSDQFEIYSFTDMAIAMSILDKSRIDVFLTSSAFTVDTDSIPKRCSFAYLVDSIEIEELNGNKAICKFQKIDLIYKQILSLYSESVNNNIGFKFGNDNTKLIIFASPDGGVGTSSVAAACAMNFASKGKKVIYLNLERIGLSESFFSGEGKYDMSDVIFALKSKKANVPLKLESSIKQDHTGVYFYSQSKLALDMYEMTVDDMVHLISELALIGSYEYIIADMDFSLEPNMISAYKHADSLVWVCDGSEISVQKTKRAYDSLAILEQNSDNPLTRNLSLIYNRFSNKTGMTIDDSIIRSVGGAPRYEHAGTIQVAEQLSKLTFYENLVQ